MFKAMFFLPRRLVKALSVFLIGVICGAAVATALIGRQVDKLTNANRSLEEKLTTTQNELQQVQENLSKWREPTVTSLEVSIEFTDHKFTRFEEDATSLSLEKQVKEILKNLPGKKIKSLDPTLIPSIVENRIMEAENHRFKLHVTLVVITEKIYLNVQAKPISDDPAIPF